MSARVDRLEALLARVQANAQKGHAASGALAGSAAEGAPLGFVDAKSTDELELDEPGVSEPPMGLEDDELDLDAEDIDIAEAPPESGPGLVGEAKSIEAAIKQEPRRPPMTPPPESGEEPAPAVSIPRHHGPTMEQLGNTISLDESGATDFELDEGTRGARRSPSEERLAADIPLTSQRPMHELELPANAREELERVRLGESKDLRPAVTDRPVISTNVVEFVSAVREFQPATFLELLDSSLRL